jgi:NADH-quinone oxidoreductase subunit E
MLRRLHPEQPESFAFTEENRRWAEAQITKYPEGRQASAIIPLLWRAQEQEGWLSRPAIEHVCEMLGMAYIRGLEVATFYFMFQLQPVGSVAHIQVCGTTSCMICGAEDLMAVCREKIAAQPHALSEDGRFSWEEVECLGACANAPMAQIGKDYYEDLTTERLAEIIDELAAGKVPLPGPQNGRYAAEPLSGLTSLKDHAEGRPEHNASVALAAEIGDTVKRIDGTEVPLRTPWHRSETSYDELAETSQHARSPHPSENAPADDTGIDRREAQAKGKGRPDEDVRENDPNQPVAPDEGGQGGTGADVAPDKQVADGDGGAPEGDEGPDKATGLGAGTAEAPEGALGSAETRQIGARPAGLEGPRESGADDLKKISGIGPALERQLNEMGYYHYDQLAGWSDEEIAWVDENLQGFRGRVTRDNWVEQARHLSQGETDSPKGAK